MDHHPCGSVLSLFFSSFRYLVVAALVLSPACSRINGVEDFPACTFAVVNIGQGLSQIGVSMGEALVWDVGDSGLGASDSLQYAYERLGSPRINAIIVSHSHVDHMGGLSKLPPSMSFSGQIITYPGEDTAFIRLRVAPERQANIHFVMIAQGDTVPGLPSVRVECLWPPRELRDSTLFIDTWKNRNSMCFRFSYGLTSALITSDIDTVAMRELSMTYGFGLKSDIMVVPHHGSASSADAVFYGYVNPSDVVIPCVKDNVYGFPAVWVMDIIYQMQLGCHRIDQQGSAIAQSDGYYWQWW